MEYHRPLICIIIGLAFIHTANAHTRGQSYSSWVVRQDSVSVVVNVPAREVTRLVAIDEESLTMDSLWLNHFRSNVALQSGRKTCIPQGSPVALAAKEGFVRSEWHFRCETAKSLKFTINTFFDIAPSHVHYARITFDNGSITEAIFTDKHRTREIGLEDNAGSPFRSRFLTHFVHGVGHIFVGYDHIAFLVGLLLLGRTLKETAILVTGFTLGHSATLFFASMEFARVQVPVIEALVAFTIALVAAEVVLVNGRIDRSATRLIFLTLAVCGILGVVFFPRVPDTMFIGLAIFAYSYLSLVRDRKTHHRSLHILLTIVFGFVHGFAFASVLQEIQLPTQEFLFALLGFNFGVEVGQLVIIIAVLVPLLLFMPYREIGGMAMSRQVVSSVLFGLGVYWFTFRILTI